MIDKADAPQPDSVQENLKNVMTLLEEDKLHELSTFVNEAHPADVAYVLEALPLDQRLRVWDLIKVERDGEILLELADAVRETLIAHMDSNELLAVAEQLDTDELADLAPDFPQEVIQDVFQSLDTEERAQLQSAMSYPEDTVGALMDFDMVAIRQDISLGVALRHLRRLGELPDHTDKLFVVDRDNILQGVLPLKRLLINDPKTSVQEVLISDAVSFRPGDAAHDAASAFERYDLVSAPVVNDKNQLIGRLTVNNVMDFIRDEASNEMLNLAGLREEEDLFASVWQRAKNRWLWLAINLVTAFISSRVIGIFEGTIEKLVALATLMPIVAGIGGNSGNQTTTLVIRAMALGQINASNATKLMMKELSVSVLNGLVWGSVVGLFAYLLYKSIPLGVVMASAMLLNLIVAAIVGILIPLSMHKLGRDPALGSSVLLTATTDSMGFFIFLGLATIFLF